jgi:hypothetical protein
MVFESIHTASSGEAVCQSFGRNMHDSPGHMMCLLTKGASAENVGPGGARDDGISARVSDRFDSVGVPHDAASNLAHTSECRFQQGFASQGMLCNDPPIPLRVLDFLEHTADLVNLAMVSKATHHAGHYLLRREVRRSHAVWAQLSFSSLCVYVCVHVVVRRCVWNGRRHRLRECMYPCLGASVHACVCVCGCGCGWSGTGRETLRDGISLVPSHVKGDSSIVSFTRLAIQLLTNLLENGAQFPAGLEPGLLTRDVMREAIKRRKRAVMEGALAHTSQCRFREGFASKGMLCDKPPIPLRVLDFLHHTADLVNLALVSKATHHAGHYLLRREVGQPHALLARVSRPFPVCM